MRTRYYWAVNNETNSIFSRVCMCVYGCVPTCLHTVIYVVSTAVLG